MVKASSNTGAAFLKIGVGARAIGMGGAYTAVADDATALYWNPAGIAGIQKKEFSAMHSEYLAGMGFDSLGLAVPQKGKNGVSRGNAIGVGISRLSQGKQEGRGENRERTGSFDAADSALALSYAGKTAGMNAGVTFKFIQSSIGSDSANTIAADVGLYKSLGSVIGGRGNRNGTLSIGMAARNIGRGLKYISERDRLPLSLAFGTAYLTPLGVNTSVEVSHLPYDNRTVLSMGTDYAVGSRLSLRAGYASKPLGMNSGREGMGISGGMGILLFNYKLDYSFIPFGELGNVQRFSLSAQF